MIKNIIFDFGGVLIDWNPEYLYKTIFEDKWEMEYFLTNICTPEWNVKQDAGRSLAEATQILQERHTKYQKEIQLFYDEWTSMLGGSIEENVLLLNSLKKNYKLLGLTNWSAETFPRAKEIFPFLNKFNGIVVSGQEKLIKPDEQIYNVLLSRYNLKACECLFIDDSRNNIKAAEKLGFQTIHFTSGMCLKSRLQELNVL